jgi:hypothetical protein
MDSKTLQESLSAADVHRRIVGDFRGAYSLGISRFPGDESGPALILRVATDDVSNFPDHIEIAGETIPIDVRANFRPPVPLRGTSPG